MKLQFPGVGWLSSRLSRKFIVAILLLAVASWAVMCGLFLFYLNRYTAQTYDSAADQAQQAALRAASCLEGSGGDLDAFGRWLKSNEMSADLRDKRGALLLDRPVIRDGLTASATASAVLPGGTVEVTVHVPALERQDLLNALTRSAFWGLLLLNLCVFSVAAILIFLLMAAPIIRLRKTMRRYYESGDRPERTNRRDEIGRLQNTFADLVSAVEQKEKAERRLIASISHDIKTPLTSVLGYSERLLASDLPQEKRRQYLQSVHEKGAAIKSIVDEFDDYIDVGLRDTAPMQLMTARELCGALQREYGDELSDAGAELQIDCLSPEARVLCNWEHMRRFFGNLISNSFQHARASRLTLSLVCRQEGNRLIFLFRDNGVGVPDGLLGQIFEPLYTSDKGRKVSGLGLSICRSIITAHGGTVSASNVPEGGLEIRAVLPAAERL